MTNEEKLLVIDERIAELQAEKKELGFSSREIVGLIHKFEIDRPIEALQRKKASLIEEMKYSG